MKLLLHACCGPCSLEPVRLLQAAGHGITIAYLNSNIAPTAEYKQRRDALGTWAAEAGIPVIEGAYKPEAWEATAGHIGDAALKAVQGDVLHVATDSTLRAPRCRACYRLRFEEAARLAADQGFDAIGTTLSVSPYQHTLIIAEELRRATQLTHVAALFEDYRPFYDEATRRSRELGMYRQNYCGCRFSNEEAAAERDQRRRERAAKRAAEQTQHADERAAAEIARVARKTERQAYAEKQARKRAALKALRDQERGA